MAHINVRLSVGGTIVLNEGITENNVLELLSQRINLLEPNQNINNLDDGVWLQFNGANRFALFQWGHAEQGQHRRQFRFSEAGIEERNRLALDLNWTEWTLTSRIIDLGIAPNLDSLHGSGRFTYRESALGNSFFLLVFSSVRIGGNVKQIRFGINGIEERDFAGVHIGHWTEWRSIGTSNELIDDSHLVPKSDFANESPEPEYVWIDGTAWATRNLGAPQTFVENIEDVGMFYQWGQQRGWSSSDPMVASDGTTIWNPSASGTQNEFWNEANIAPNGWTIPSEEQIENLMRQPSEWAVVNGQAGRWYGIAPNRIFLPAGGQRENANGNLVGVNTIGNYWRNQGTIGASSRNINFSQTQQGQIQTMPRARAFNLRLVARNPSPQGVPDIHDTLMTNSTVSRVGDNLVFRDNKTYYDKDTGAKKNFTESSAINIKPKELDDLIDRVDNIESILQSGVKKKDIEVVFIDHEGVVSIQHFYFGESVTEFPTPREYEDLTFDEWNFDLSELQDLQWDVVVGATYRSTDGSTIFNITLNKFTERTVSFGITLSDMSSYEIDWGDGTTTYHTGSDNITHLYANFGRYKIKIKGENNTTLLINNLTQGMLTNAILGDNVINDSSFFFRNCSILESIVIPKRINSQADSGFSNCARLKSFVIPKGTNVLPFRLFETCVALESVSIPNTVTTLNDRVFDNCSLLKNVVSPPTAVGVGGLNVFNNAVSITSARISTGLSAVRSSYFWNCQSLEKVEIPDGVTSLDVSCFSLCTKIKTIRIPSSVTTLGNSTFGNCLSMEEYIFERTAPLSITFSSFTNIPRNTIIYVPDESVDAYKTATNWVALANQIFPISDRLNKTKIVAKTAMLSAENVEYSTIKAEAGKVYKRKHDGLIMGDEINLGLDFSTGEQREDKAEYYEEVDASEIVEIIE